MLELTESAVASDADAVVERCWALRELGVRLAVDDFGTGTSSLAELRNLPVDVLKLAKPFVDALETRPGEREFVRVIVELGRVLGLTVAAEGVETEGQLALLRELGVDVAQGNLMAAAEAAAAIEHHLRAAARDRRGLSGGSGQRVLGPGAALGRRQAPALGGDRTALHAVGRRDLELDEAVLALRRRPRRPAPGRGWPRPWRARAARGAGCAGDRAGRRGCGCRSRTPTRACRTSACRRARRTCARRRTSAARRPGAWAGARAGGRRAACPSRRPRRRRR